MTEKPVEQEAFENFEVRCRKCGSLRVEWFNNIGFSEVSGPWGGAGFRCLECGTETEMFEA